MPVVTCEACNDTIYIKNADWRYLFSGPYYCSKECLTQYIHSAHIPRDPRDNTDGPEIKYLDSKIVNLSTGGVWSDRHKIAFRSKYEQKFANYLTDEGFVFEYEPYSFLLDSGSYTPDFYLPDSDLFVEVKGSWGFGSKSKMKRFIEQYPDVRLIVVPWTLREEFMV